MTATFHVGDAIEVMSKLPENSVDLVLTSPPFLALRSYLPADHPDKALEGGSQATPGEYIDWLIDIAEACDRVLAPHGSMCIELGDTYAGSGGAGGDYDKDGWRDGQPTWAGSANRVGLDAHPDGFTGRRGHGAGGGPSWPLPKSLSLIPELFRLTLVYGVNPLTGRQTDRWRLRNVVRWVRPNPPVGALGDKFRPATSELMVFCKSAKRYFDLDAVREPHKPHTLNYYTDGAPYLERLQADDARHAAKGKTPNRADGGFMQSAGVNPAGAPPLDWWKIADEEAPHHDLTRDRIYDVLRGWTLGLDDDYSASQCAAAIVDALTVRPNTAPPLDWWNIPLLEGEEETRYGPKPKGHRDGESLGLGPKRQAKRELGDEVAGLAGLRRDGMAITERIINPLGSLPLDWWNIPPGGYEGAHYAVFPPELCVKPIKAMCPEKVCRKCGEPSRRIVGDVRYIGTSGGLEGEDLTEYAISWKSGTSEGIGNNKYADGGGKRRDGNMSRSAETTGFSDCGHDDWRPGLVLDPFGGSGTTALVATGHGRDCILVDLDERNYALALDRVGPFILERAS